MSLVKLGFIEWLKDKLPKVKPFPVLALVREKRQNGFKLYFTKARRIVDRENQKEQYELHKGFNKTVKTKPVDYGNVDKLEEGYDFIQVYSPDFGQYKAVSFIEKKDLFKEFKDLDQSEKEDIEGNAGTYTTDEAEWKRWGTLQAMEKRASWEEKSGIERWMPLILVVGTGAAIAFIIMASTQFMGSIGQDFTAAAETMKQAAQILKDSGVSTPP